MTGAAEKKRARGSPHWHNVGLDLWCGTDCKKAPLEAAGIRKKDDESLAAWYFSRRDKLAELEGGSFCGVASVLYRNPFAGLVVGLAISPFRDPEAETTHMLSPPSPLKRQSWGVSGGQTPLIKNKSLLVFVPIQVRQRCTVDRCTPQDRAENLTPTSSKIRRGRFNLTARPNTGLRAPFSVCLSISYQGSNSGAG